MREMACTMRERVMSSLRRSGRVLAVAAALVCLAGTPAVAAEPKVVLGITHREAEKYNVEFMQYDWRVPAHKKNGIQPSLCELNCFWGTDWPDARIDRMLRRFHVVHFETKYDGVPPLTPQRVARAKRAGKVLARYVRAGGGLFLNPQSVRYANTDALKYWNVFLEPFGIKVLREGIADKTRPYKVGNPPYQRTFWYTGNIRPHPVTRGVESLYLPIRARGGSRFPSMALVQYSPEWQVIVRGEKEAASYPMDVDNHIRLDRKGTQASAPPVVAVRSFGKGRIVCYPLYSVFAGKHYGMPGWPHVVESRGDPTSGRPSHSMKMQMNAYHWLAETALKDPQFGTYRPEPYKTVTFPKMAKPLAEDFPKPETVGNGIRGILGVHTAYTDGKGTVAEYVAAAKAAGLKFIVFTDPMEKLTPKTLDQLKADCAAANMAGDFYACPGVEFTDGIGCRWAYWGEKVAFPAASFRGGFSASRFTYTQWDGKRIRHFGKYADACAVRTGCALLDYGQLHAAGGHHEKLWWSFYYTPFVYEKDKLIARNFDDYLHGLRDLRWAQIGSFTRITDPADVALAAQTCFTGFSGFSHVEKALNNRGSAYYQSLYGGQYVSQGPTVFLRLSGTQMSTHWRHTRGGQRARVMFVARSDDGIAEVKVHDADLGVVRRFDGHGAKEFSRVFEIVHDRQRYLVLDVVDTKGKRAITTNIKMYCYQQGQYRCGDNLNTLDATGMIWHPDRNQMLPLAKPFHNASDFKMKTDGGQPVCPRPRIWSNETVNIQGVGTYPNRYKIHKEVGKVLDVVMSSRNIQIATMHMNKLSEMAGTEKRPNPALATTPRDVGELEFFERSHTSYAPQERFDYFVAWLHRRKREARKDWRGALIWHEGVIRFKKDVTLTGHVPIPLVVLNCPVDLERNVGHTTVVVDADRGTCVEMATDTPGPVRTTRGRLRPGGYAAQLPTRLGCYAFFAPTGEDFAYESYLPGSKRAQLTIGLGRKGQKVKADTVMRYRFAIGTFPGPVTGNVQLQHTAKAFNMGGGHEGYPVQMKVGTIADATFFFTAKAKGNEAVFTLGPQKLCIDLPIRIKGLEDNGCAAVYCTERKWFRFVPVVEDTAYFLESIDRVNEMWVGNIFVCDNRALKLTVVVDDQAPGKPPFIEVHNPTKQRVATKLWSPAHTPRFGGMSATVTVPAGDSVRLRMKDRTLEPMKPQ